MPLSKTERTKAAGKCPWSKCPCRTAPLCTMTKQEACYHLVSNQVNTCSVCREAARPCANVFLCFRDVREAERRRK